MNREFLRTLPLVRLAIYVVVFVGCGAVVVREVYFAIRCTTTTATVRSVGSSTVTRGGRAGYFFADYDYLDAEGIRHSGRANLVPAVTRAGDQVEVQYFPYSPASSRLTPSPVWGLSFAAIALLAAAVLAAEIGVRWRRRKGE
jgi:hypothetical protein